MPLRAPRICPCGHTIAADVACPCEEQRARARKARHDANRPSARERGYDSKWQNERRSFLFLNRTCVRCGAPSTIVNHKVPHRGDLKLFWSRSNWEAVCKPCHDGPIQAAECREHRP